MPIFPFASRAPCADIDQSRDRFSQDTDSDLECFCFSVPRFILICDPSTALSKRIPPAIVVLEASRLSPPLFDSTQSPRVPRSQGCLHKMYGLRPRIVQVGSFFFNARPLIWWRRSCNIGHACRSRRTPLLLPSERLRRNSALLLYSCYVLRLPHPRRSISLRCHLMRHVVSQKTKYHEREHAWWNPRQHHEKYLQQQEPISKSIGGRDGIGGSGR